MNPIRVQVFLKRAVLHTHTPIQHYKEQLKFELLDIAWTIKGSAKIYLTA